jgi:site-specific DNA-cytosine methylase
MNVVSLFAGSGGFGPGFRRAGYCAILTCENRALAKAMLRARPPNYPTTTMSARRTTYRRTPTSFAPSFAARI